MSGYAQQAQEYLRLRKALGHKLAEAHRLLPSFTAYLDEIAAPAITIEAALAWAQLPDAGPGTSVWARRMAVARGFARHMSGIEPATEVPPAGLVTFRQRWRPPFIYSPADVQALMGEVPRLVPAPLRAATFQTMIGLLAATGMRIGEVIALGRGDIDWAEDVIVVRDAKFGKSREVPLDPTVAAALARYAALRDQALPAPASSAFFLSGRGSAVSCSDFESRFRQLLARTGVGAGAPARPRVHDLRHSFAVHTLARWYRAGEDVAALLPRLSTYLGHLIPGYTYRYLSATPELLQLAAARLEKAKEAGQ